jgi:hypothetical protein
LETYVEAFVVMKSVVAHRAKPAISSLAKNTDRQRETVEARQVWQSAGNMKKSAIYL